MDNYWDSFELAFDAFRISAINGIMVDWCGGRVSGMAAAGLHTGQIPLEAFDVLMEIRKAWESYGYEQSLKRSAA